MRFAIMATLLVSALVAPASTMAAGNGTVSAQVTVATPCITVGSNINYGTKAFSTLSPFVSKTSNGTSSYTNCSSDPEKIYVRGSNAVSTSSAATWQLTGTNACNAGVNRYYHSVGDDVGGANLTLSDQLINPAAAAGATKTLFATVEMPCSGSDGAGETMTFSITVTASF
jgi:hypothetical protein